MTTYRIVLVPEEEGGFSVFVPALPRCFSQGETREEAIAMAREAIRLHLESLRANGDPLPVDNTELATVEVAISAT